ncbi:hypothetical protein [Alcanivorax sediminis]|uniref:Uncharacterized protein n=1 Tax=Alcanivorax sediminis TaxID=2663008 RepID=A0A6N7LYW8_9GAMM|nr:hypothetical protein [Alcanivorax sediminis]MQX54374.1 hypothetical protein [Alcanivorax sediminis]
MTMVCGLTLVGLWPDRHGEHGSYRGSVRALPAALKFGCVFGYANIELITAFYIPFSL